MVLETKKYILTDRNYYSSSNEKNVVITAGWNDLSLIGKAGVVDCDDDESSTRFSLSFNNSCKEKKIYNV